jgi:16S rRNA (guanine966-N2)-methyltransferase
MRVVGGSARGRRLVAPAGSYTRPTTDRVREAIMNALWSRGVLEGATVLDLFAGSGALGIEALSRGASHAVFVDDDPRARRAVVQNLEACGFRDRAEVVAEQAERFVTNWVGRHPPAGRGSRFDVAFCDPPYTFDRWDVLLTVLPAALVVMESGAPIALPPGAGWELVRSSHYGTAWVGFAERAEDVESDGAG